MSTEHEARARDIAAELAAAGRAFVAALEELAGPARELADADARYRAALNQAGSYDRRPAARELASEALHARLECLWPYLPAVTSEAGRRAAEALTGPPQIVAR